MSRAAAADSASLTLTAANLDAVLAVVAEASYRDDDARVAGLESAGYAQLDLEGDGNGTVVAGNAAFDAWTTVAGGQTVAILAFRGTDDVDYSTDGLSAYRGSDDAAFWLDTTGYYDLLDAGLTAFDAAVEALGITQVYVTGHSLGGAAAQAYMTEHADTAATRYDAVVFGSLGLSGGSGDWTTDARVTAFVDPSDFSSQLGVQTAGLTVSFTGAEASLDTGLDLSALISDPASFLDSHSSDLFIDAALRYDAAKAGLAATDKTTFFTATVSVAGLSLTVSPA
ncbi:alpha/beta hydrolase [Solidesulfovibrio sp.]